MILPKLIVEMLALKSFIAEYWEIFAGIIVGLTGWFKELIFFKSKVKKENTAIEGENIQNLSSAVDLYQKLIDDIIPRYEKEQKELREEIKYYRIELDKYRKEIKNRDKEIVSLHKEINELRAQMIKLQRDYENGTD